MRETLRPHRLPRRHDHPVTKILSYLELAVRHSEELWIEAVFFSVIIMIAVVRDGRLKVIVILCAVLVSLKSKRY